MCVQSDEQRRIVREASQLANEAFDEMVSDWARIPWPNIERLVDRGIYGINFDEAYGGGGMGEYEAMFVTEAIDEVCPDTARIFNMQHMVAPQAIEMFGKDAAKERFLPPVIQGKTPWRLPS